MTLLSSNFYPTPHHLIEKMWGKVESPKDILSILEPSAGKGDIVEYIKEKAYRYNERTPSISAIELCDELFATLLGKDIKVIDRDFLAYSGGDIFDLIIMNPPFDAGDKHLMAAIDLLYSGQIVCLLNAETIKNPYSRSRKTLVARLEDLGADIEYLQDEFQSAQRRTRVEVALVHIKIERDIKQDLFQGATDCIQGEDIKIEEDAENDIALRDTLHNLELEYQMKKSAGVETIRTFYSNHNKISDILEINIKDRYGLTDKDTSYKGNNYSKDGEIYKAMQTLVNGLNSNLRERYWKKAMDLPEISERMTTQNLRRFNTQLRKHASLEFTANNVRSFIVNLIGSYGDTLFDAATKLFDDLTRTHSYWSEENTDNTLHFSTWKTNQAYKVGRKIILPFSEGAFEGILSYSVVETLGDMDKVLNYIAGHRDYLPTAELIKDAIDCGLIGRKVPTKSTFFKDIKFYKKGTLHLTFESEDVLRKFNIIACKGKKWLPKDYGYKQYGEYEQKDKDIVDSFEGKETYDKNINNPPTFANNTTLLIEDRTRAERINNGLEG